MAKVYVTIYIEKEYSDEDLDRAESLGYSLIGAIRELGDDSEFDRFESTLDITSQYLPNGDSGD